MLRRLIPLTMVALLGCAAPALAAAEPPAPIETTIDAGPAEGATIEGAEPTFEFSATIGAVPMPGAAFLCKVDDEEARSCASPFKLPALEEEGAHSFAVDAEDPLSLDRDPTPAVRDFFLLQAEESEDEECEGPEEGESEEEEFEEGEECEDGRAPPAECLLRSARARLIASPARERVRLVVRYTDYAPADVEVAYRIGGARGSLRLGDVRAHFAKHGVFRDTARLGISELAKVRAARRFTVELGVPAAPSFCRRYELRHLTVRRASHGQAVWLQSDSPFGLEEG